MDSRPSADSIAALAAARDRVLAVMAQACTRSGRDPSEVELVAVSKTVSIERLRAAVPAGLTLLGENRVQEAEPKIEALEGVRWHLVGHLQANKAKRAVSLFDTIESVDSLELAVRLDRLVGEVGRRLNVYIQVNVDRDEAKEGFLPEELEAALPSLAGLSNLRLRGLMTVGRLVGTAEEARPTFVRLRELSERLRSSVVGAGLEAGLSMGMTDDYPVAVEEGATVIRVGRAIFGERPIG